MLFEIGSAVESTIYGYQGSIDLIAPNFWQVYDGPKSEGMWWLDQQSVEPTKDQINNERWYHVNGFGKESFFSCESRLRLISPVNFKDPLSFDGQIASVEKQAGQLYLVLYNRIESWSGKMPLLVIQNPTIIPYVGDWIYGTSQSVSIAADGLIYPYKRDRDILTQDW
jgi:hypothetical protein